MSESVANLGIGYARNLLVVSETVEILFCLVVIQFPSSDSRHYTTYASRLAQAMVESWTTPGRSRQAKNQVKITLKPLGDIPHETMEKLKDRVGDMFHCPVEIGRASCRE